jgi:hypothetical protein
MSKSEDVMSTYEARCGKAVTGNAAISTPAIGIASHRQADAVIRRGRKERSLAVWAMLQAVFGRPEARDQDEQLRVSDEGLI